MKNKLTRKKNSKRRFLSKTKRKHPIKRKSNNKKTIKKKKLKRRTRKNTRGGNKTVKLFDKTYSIQDVKYDGDCMYHSILRATKEKGKEPGTMRNEKGEYFTPKDLRKYLVENVPNYSDIKEHYGEILPEIMSQIKDGIKNPRNPNNWGSQPIVEFVNRIFDVDIQIVDKSKNFQLMSAGKPISDETILLLWVKGAHYMWLKEEQEDPITPKKEEKEKQQDPVSPTHPNPLESEDASGVPGPSINLLELLKKKKENPEPYRLTENALTDEEIIKNIQSLKHGDESLNMLDDYDYDFNKGTKLRGKQSPLYYAGKNFGLPVVKALIDAGADPNKMLKGINVVGVPTVYDGETALDLLVEDFKKILTDKKHIEQFLKHTLYTGERRRNIPDYEDTDLMAIQGLKKIKLLNLPKKFGTTKQIDTWYIPMIPWFSRKYIFSTLIPEEQEKIKNISPPVLSTLQTEIDRLGSIIDYLIPLTNTNAYLSSLCGSKVMKKYNDAQLKPREYDYRNMKHSPIWEAIKSQDVGKTKLLINRGFKNINSYQSDNPNEDYPLFEAYDELENYQYDGNENNYHKVANIEEYPAVKIIKLIIDAGAILDSGKEKDQKQLEFEKKFITRLYVRILRNRFSDGMNYPETKPGEERDIYEHVLQYAFKRGAKLVPYKDDKKSDEESDDETNHYQEWYDNIGKDNEEEIDPDEYFKDLYEKSKTLLDKEQKEEIYTINDDNTTKYKQPIRGLKFQP